MAKIERKYLAHYVNADTTGSSPEYVRLGKDLEEYSPEMSAEVETTKNILGETSINISSYEKTGSAEPYYAEKDDPLFDRLLAIIDGNLVLDDLKTDVVEVKLWETEQSGAYPATKEEAYIEITCYGGDTTGYQITFTLHYTGVKTEGTFNPKTKTFTEGVGE